MAKFTLELPTDIMDDFKRIYGNSDKIFGGMTEAGAKVALENVKANAPAGWKSSAIMNNIGLTRTYKTPSDDGINTKVIISGYFINHNGVKTPAPLVANVFEYGSTKFAKKPFFRKSFRKSQIEQAMLKAQKELSGGLLENE
jgi:hypothetical protein